MRSSLERQRRLFAASIILTPVDNIPMPYGNSHLHEFLQGLYVSDKIKKETRSLLTSKILFAGRNRATLDVNRVHYSLARSLGAEKGSFRLLSGLHAHIAIFMSLAAIGDKVLLLPEAAGGHFSTKGILERLGLNVIEMVVDYDNYCTSKEKTKKLISRHKPQFVFVDRSEGLRYEDFSFLGGLSETIKIFDASQYLPQIMTGEYENPLSWGFDFLVFTVHKSFPGPQKAGVVAREGGVAWERLMEGLGRLVSSAHVESTYRVGLALAEPDRLAKYAKRLTQTACLLEGALAKRGVPVFDRRKQGDGRWPATHHLWITFPTRTLALSAYGNLARVRIQTNYRLLPYRLGWGLRLGTSAAVMTGLTTEEVGELSGIIASVIEEGFSLGGRHTVRQLSERMSKNAFTAWPSA